MPEQNIWVVWNNQEDGLLDVWRQCPADKKAILVAIGDALDLADTFTRDTIEVYQVKKLNIIVDSTKKQVNWAEAEIK